MDQGRNKPPEVGEWRQSISVPERRNMTTQQQFDQERAEAFAERLMDVLNSGALALMTSIGTRTGLFEAMAGLPPSTSEQIASAATLKERYVREWLAAMVVGRIIEHNPQDGTYYLPQEHAAFLARAASPDNIAVTAQFIPLMGSVEDPIVESFKNGGGVPYSAFPHLHEVMAEDSGQTVVAALTDHILPLVPGLTERLETGIDVLDVGWRQRACSPTVALSAATSPRRGSPALAPRPKSTARLTCASRSRTR